MNQSQATFQQVHSAHMGGLVMPEQLVAQSSDMYLTDKLRYDAVLSMVNQAQNPDQLRESLATRMLGDRGIAEGGTQIHNSFDRTADGQIPHLEVSKYGRTASGATAMVTATDPQNGETYVLLGRKWLDPQRPELGLGEFVAPGGYMKPKPLEGAAASQDYDEDLAQTAMRELREETHLVFDPSYRPKSLGVDSRASSNQLVHMTNEFFHIDVAATPENMSKIKAGDDLASLSWVRARDIRISPDIGEQPDGSNQSRYQVLTEQGIVQLRDLHGSYLEAAVTQSQMASFETKAHKTAAQTPQNDNHTAAEQQNQWQNYIVGRRNQPELGHASFVKR